MKTKNRQDRQKGSAHLVVILAVVAILVGVLGFVGFDAWNNKQQAEASTAKPNRYMMALSFKTKAIRVNPGHTKNVGSDVKEIQRWGRVTGSFAGYPNAKYAKKNIYISNGHGGYNIAYKEKLDDKLVVNEKYLKSRLSFSINSTDALKIDLCKTKFVAVVFDGDDSSKAYYVQACTLNDARLTVK